MRDGDMLMVLDPVSAVGIMDDCSCVISVQTWVKQAQNEWRKICFCDAKTHQPTFVTWTATCLSWPLLTGSPEQINLKMLSLCWWDGCLSLRRLQLLMCIWENEIWVMVSIKGSRRPPLGSIYSDICKCPSYVMMPSHCFFCRRPVWVLSVCDGETLNKKICDNCFVMSFTLVLDDCVTPEVHWNGHNTSRNVY